MAISARLSSLKLEGLPVPHCPLLYEPPGGTGGPGTLTGPPSSHPEAAGVGSGVATGAGPSGGPSGDGWGGCSPNEAGSEDVYGASGLSSSLGARRRRRQRDLVTAQLVNCRPRRNGDAEDEGLDPWDVFRSGPAFVFEEVPAAAAGSGRPLRRLCASERRLLEVGSIALELLLKDLLRLCGEELAGAASCFSYPIFSVVRKALARIQRASDPLQFRRLFQALSPCFRRQQLPSQLPPQQQAELLAQVLAAERVHRAEQQQKQQQQQQAAAADAPAAADGAAVVDAAAAASARGSTETTNAADASVAAPERGAAALLETELAPARVLTDSAAKADNVAKGAGAIGAAAEAAAAAAEGAAAAQSTTGAASATAGGGAAGAPAPIATELGASAAAVATDAVEVLDAAAATESAGAALNGMLAGAADTGELAAAAAEAEAASAELAASAEADASARGYPHATHNLVTANTAGECGSSAPVDGYEEDGAAAEASAASIVTAVAEAAMLPLGLQEAAAAANGGDNESSSSALSV
ncbi:hypothetical protein Emag_007306 [Eimeria magna]